ncbi:sugar transferase [bacterium]|nr:MAG: sugar transferase [bacterium]
MAKRTFDLVLTILGAPLVLPILAILALALAIELRGNPFFLQARVGLQGRSFTLFKLRTMRHPRPGEVQPHLIDDWKTFIFSPPGTDNPRITRLGAFARKTSFDELPNLLNVLLGQMSLVGPRPELPGIVAQYPPHYHRRHDVPPGITGLAQVSGRSDLTYDEIVNYDLAYVDQHSVMTDIHILWRTFFQALTGKGAR